jgi:hypothetical protein
MPDMNTDLIRKLESHLTNQNTRVKRYEMYYNGEQWRQTAFLASTKFQEYFFGMIRSVSDNWMPTVVDAAAERLTVEGFRNEPGEIADQDAYKIWQYNYMDLVSKALFDTVLTCGISFLMVWHSGDSDYPVLMTAEHPSEVYVLCDPATGLRKAAIKKWIDDDLGADRLNLYLPEAIFKYWWPRSGGINEWTPLPGEEVIPNPMGVVPVIPIRNRVNLHKQSWSSELHDVMSTQDQINKLVMDMMVASEFGAFRQRWATGLDIPIDEATGKPVEVFKAAIDRFWSNPDPAGQFGEFSATDLGNYVKAIENRVQSLASRSRTPAHYLLGQNGTMPSGETLHATETGLIAKVKRHMLEYDDGLEEAMRLAFFISGQEGKAKNRSLETVWKDPEYRTESEHIDATVKKLALGVPLEQLWADAGYTPTQRMAFREMLKEQIALTQGLPMANLGQAGNNGAPGAPAGIVLPNGVPVTPGAMRGTPALKVGPPAEAAQ